MKASSFSRILALVTAMAALALWAGSPKRAEAQDLGQLGTGSDPTMPCGPLALDGCAVCDGECLLINGDRRCFPSGPPFRPFCVPPDLMCPEVGGETAAMVPLSVMTAGGPVRVTLCIYPRHRERYCLGELEGPRAADRVVDCYRFAGTVTSFEGGDCDRDGVVNGADLCCNPPPDTAPGAPSPVDPETGCPFGEVIPLPSLDGLVCHWEEARPCMTNVDCAEVPGRTVCECVLVDGCSTFTGGRICTSGRADNRYHCVPGPYEGADPSRSVCPDREGTFLYALRLPSGDTLCVYTDDGFDPCVRAAADAGSIDLERCFHRVGEESTVAFEQGDCDGDGRSNGDEAASGCACDASTTCGLVEIDGGNNGEDAGPSGGDAGPGRFDAGPAPPSLRYGGGGLGTCACSLGRPHSPDRGPGLALLGGLLGALALGARALRRRRSS